ncbi:MAG: T9SS type A sorting domain-containing protein, partial [Mucilaginibacter sp.]
VFTGGGYNQYTPSVSVSTKIPVVIQSARLYIGYPGKITFNVTNVSGEIVSSATLDVSATATNPQPGPQNDDPNDQGQVYQLGLLLPSAGIYSITAVYDNAVTIYRSNSGVTGYPFKIGNVFSITGNTASSATDTAYYKGFYYFFYDMKLKSPGCASASRQAVTVVKPVITQNGTTLTSNFATGNQWYLDGSPIDGAIDQNYSPKQSGNYSVYVTVSDGCVAQSDNFTYIIVPANSTENDIGLSVFPVPANDQLSVIFASPANAALKLTLVNSRGEVNYSENKTIQAGGYNTSINVSQMAPGTYVLNVRLGQKNYTKKVIIGR